MKRMSIGLLVLFSFTQCLYTHKAQKGTSGTIDRRLRLSAVSDRDTVTANDTFLLTVSFINRADSVLSLYPGAGLMTLFSARPAVVFDGPPSDYILDTVLDAREASTVEPSGSYTKTYKIPVLVRTSAYNPWEDDFAWKVSIYAPSTGKRRKAKEEAIILQRPPIFDKGENTFYIRYTIGGEGDMLHGHLESDQFKIFVK